MFSRLTHLSCTRCGTLYERGRRVNVCAKCGGALFPRYHVRAIDRDAVAGRPRTIWRWHELMPVEDPVNVVTLGEGGTPLLRADRLGERSAFRDLWIKDEAANPTGSFKARGLSAAVSKAKEFGYTKIAVPTAGNAGGAASAYAAKAGMECHVFMPADTPPVFRIECERYGAKVTMVDGLIDDCGRLVAESAAREGWHDVSTLKEPFRVEGKKTMGYELAEDFAWTLPDAILYPTGGGTGLIGMWKAFDEMEELGWIDGRRPKMFAVQAEGCAPIPKAFAEGRLVSEKFPNAHTYASGLRVPKPFADYLILQYVRESAGSAVTVTDDEMRRACDEIGAAEGLFVAPEGGAAWAAAKKLQAAGTLDPASRVVLFNTGSGFKYL
ncbi:MAG TPA: threonine synthase [Thermoanaerobaculia bacterium]|jgi:threonine synthase|nr:threonine synthase [Thermoanaerobaculia bacterium]